MPWNYILNADSPSSHEQRSLRRLSDQKGWLFIALEGAEYLVTEAVGLPPTMETSQHHLEPGSCVSQGYSPGWGLKQLLGFLLSSSCTLVLTEEIQSWTKPSK